MTSFFWFGSCGSCGDGLTKKTSDPRMTTANNPLAEPRDQLAARQLEERNMTKLRRDAELRAGHNGHVYSALMDTRYQRED